MNKMFTLLIPLMFIHSSEQYDQLCNGIKIDVNTAICCQDLIYLRGDAISPACCNSIAYDSQTHICCSGTLSVREGPRSRCCFSTNQRSLHCADSKSKKRPLAGSKCCHLSEGMSCCKIHENCCSNYKGRILNVPGFQPVCCSIRDTREKSLCCSNITENTKGILMCCNEPNVRPKCCYQNNKLTCCPSQDSCCTNADNFQYNRRIDGQQISSEVETNDRSEAETYGSSSCCNHRNVQAWCCKRNNQQEIRREHNNNGTNRVNDRSCCNIHGSYQHASCCNREGIHAKCCGSDEHRTPDRRDHINNGIIDGQQISSEAEKNDRSEAETYGSSSCCNHRNVQAWCCKRNNQQEIRREHNNDGTNRVNDRSCCNIHDVYQYVTCCNREGINAKCCGSDDRRTSDGARRNISSNIIMTNLINSDISDREVKDSPTKSFSLGDNHLLGDEATYDENDIHHHENQGSKIMNLIEEEVNNFSPVNNSMLRNETFIEFVPHDVMFNEKNENSLIETVSGSANVSRSANVYASCCSERHIIACCSNIYESHESIALCCDAFIDQIIAKV